MSRRIDVPPDVPRDEDLRTLLQVSVPQHLDGFWEDLEVSLRSGSRLSPLDRVARRRWVAPAAAAAAVVAVVGGTMAVRAVTGAEGPAPEIPAGPASVPATAGPDGSAVVRDWEDLEPGAEYAFVGEPPPSFRALPPTPGAVTGVSYWVDDAGRHTLVRSTETAVRETGPNRARVVTTAAHATAATLTDDGWVVTNRVTEPAAEACEAPYVTASRPFPEWAAGIRESEMRADRPPLLDWDRDGRVEIEVALMSRCEDGDWAVRHVTLDGRDAYELRGPVTADWGVPEDFTGEGGIRTTRPAPPTAVPAPEEWPDGLYWRALDSYNLWFTDVE